MCLGGRPRGAAPIQHSHSHSTTTHAPQRPVHGQIGRQPEQRPRAGAGGNVMHGEEQGVGPQEEEELAGGAEGGEAAVGVVCGWFDGWVGVGVGLVGGCYSLGETKKNDSNQ